MAAAELARSLAAVGGGFVAGGCCLRAGPEANAISSAYSPPRSTVHAPKVRSGTTVVAPVRSQRLKKRKRRGRGDAGDSGGDDGPGDGGSWGGGGWGDDGEGESNPPWQVQNLWAWQVICIGSLLQAAHYLLLQRKGGDSEGGAAKYAMAAAA